MGRVGTFGQGFGGDGGEGTRPFSLPPARAPTPKSGRWEGRAGTGQGAAEAGINFLGSSRLFRLLCSPRQSPPPRSCRPGRTSAAPLSARSRRRGRGRCRGRGGTRYLRRGGARARGAPAGLRRRPGPVALGGHTLCCRGSFGHCVASARPGGTNRPRVRCGIPAGDRRCRLTAAR